MPEKDKPQTKGVSTPKTYDVGKGTRSGGSSGNNKPAPKPGTGGTKK